MFWKWNNIERIKVKGRDHLDRGPQGRHLHAAQQGRRGSLPQGGAGFQAGEHHPRRLRQHHGQRHRRDDHDADRQPERHQLDLLFLQRRRRARRRAGAGECRLHAPTRAWASASTAAAPATRSAPASRPAFRGTMWLNSANHGALAVKLLLASIKDKRRCR